MSSSLRFLDPPLVFTRARGSRIWDADGREYVDFHAGFGPIILGHADDRVRERAMETAAELDVVGAGSSELEIELAEKIRQHVPSAERVLFSNSGSEATYHAIRVVAGRDRSAARREVPGLLPRLARLHRGERDQPSRPGRHASTRSRPASCRRRSTGWSSCRSTTSRRSRT